jgi:hypothetical protein
MIVFGSSIGASYNPDTNTWQRLAPSTLAPEASSVGWIGRRLVAWDYEGDTQDYSPSANGSSATSASFGFSCVSAASSRNGDVRVFCGQAATVARPRVAGRRFGGVTAHGAVRQHGSSSTRPPRSLSRACIALAATGVVIDAAAHASDASARRSRTGRTAPNRVALDGPPMRQSLRLHLAAGPQHASLRVGTRDSATRSRSSQPGREARLSPVISRWMAPDGEVRMSIGLPRDVPGGTVRRARARSGVTDLVSASRSTRRRRTSPSPSVPAALGQRRAPGSKRRTPPASPSSKATRHPPSPP